MPSGSISSKFHLELEQDHPNEPQVLVIKYRVGACFFNKDAFNSFIHDVVQNGRDACSMAQACHNKIIKMKKISNKYDIANKHCNMVMKIQHTFFCEDIFETNDYHGEYENTGENSEFLIQ